MTVDLSAIARWPNVPACYDWLSLDRRGDWRLQGERITHRGLIDFINRQYGVDESGNWFLQNGPQRFYVNLAYTPWVFRSDAGGLISHTGETTGEALAALLDEHGNVLLDTPLGIGLLDDRDLAGFLSACRDREGNPADENLLADLMQGKEGRVFWKGTLIQPIRSGSVAARYAFNPDPKP